MRHCLLEQLEILCRQFRADEGESRQIPARVSQARREARSDRVSNSDEDDGHRRGQVPHRNGGRGAERHDHVEVQGSQVAREEEERVPPPLGKAMLDLQVLSLDVAEVPQSLREGLKARSGGALCHGAESEEPHAALLPRRLRTGNARRRQDTGRRDERPSLYHRITHYMPPSPSPLPQGERESYRRGARRADQIFQLLIHSRSLEPAGFIAVLVDTTSIGLMVTKS